MPKRAPNSEMLKIRKALGLSQAAFGAPADISQPQINKLETGRAKMTVEYAQRLAAAHRFDPWSLFPDMPRFSTGSDAELARRAAAVARRLVDDHDEWLSGLIVSLAYALLDHARRGYEITDDDMTLRSIEDVLRGYPRR